VVQRQPEQELVSTPSRRLSLLLVALLPLACRDERGGAADPSDEVRRPAAERTVLAGDAGGLFAVLAPLGVDDATPGWHQAPLAARLAPGPLLALRVYRLADGGGEPLRLSPLTLEVRTRDGRRLDGGDLVLAAGATRADRTVLAARSLATYRDRELAVGSGFEAWVAFEGADAGASESSPFTAATLTAGDLVVELVERRVGSEQFAAMAGDPRRDRITYVARAPRVASEGPSLRARDEQRGTSEERHGGRRSGD
jgi:hypothetical protein